MRIANVSGRIALIVGTSGREAIDIERASQGRFKADPQALYASWDDFVAWAKTTATTSSDAVAFADADLGPVTPLPPQVFAIGVNYGAHAKESGLETATKPVVFTKFPSSVSGPFDTIELPAGSVDYEVELVAVIGKRDEHVPAEKAWSYVAGLTMGQDLSERELQLEGPSPQQFSMGKSYKGFTPIGPVLVTIDEFANPDDVKITTSINGTELQNDRTSAMIFSIPKIIAFLSGVTPLLPGDLLFTGTPSGIGWSRSPKVLLKPGDELVTTGEGIGAMRHHFVAARH